MPIGGGGIGLPDYSGIMDPERYKGVTGALYKKLYANLKGFTGSEMISRWLAGSFAMMAEVSLMIIGFFVGIFVNIGTPLLTIMLKAVLQARQNTIPEQLEISSAVLSEFLGVEIEHDKLKPGQGPDASIRAANQIGGALHDRLEKEFAPSGTVTLASGAAAARTFSGYCVNFGVQNAMLSQLAEGISAHYLEHFRELGEEVAQNLGLGRLQRRAMGPLIDNTISTPYDRHLKAKYRPELLQPADYVRAYYAGRLTRAQLSERIGQKGITEADIDELIKQVASDFGQADIARLIRFGELTRERAIQILRDQGWPEEVAKIRLRAVELSRVDGKEAEYVNVAEQQYVDGFIDDLAFNKVLDKTHLSDEEKQWERNIVGQRKDAARKRVSLSDMRRMYLAAIITLSEFSEYLVELGYSDADQHRLLFDLLSTAAEDGAKEKAKAAAAAAKAAKAAGTTAPH